jgi:hypothetical protein
MDVIRLLRAASYADLEHAKWSDQNSNFSADQTDCENVTSFLLCCLLEEGRYTIAGVKPETCEVGHFFKDGNRYVSPDLQVNDVVTFKTDDKWEKLHVMQVYENAEKRSVALFPPPPSVC